VPIIDDIMTDLNRSIKVLHLCSSSGFFGAENVIIELSKGMVHFGVDPIVGIFNNIYNPHTELASEASRNGIKFKIFNCRNILDLRTVNEIKLFIKSKNVDILHTHGYKTNAYGILASTRKNIKVATNHAWVKANLKSKFYCAIDSVLIRFFENIIAVSDTIKADMVKKGIADNKIHVIYNGIDAKRFDKKKNDVINLKNELRIRKNCKVVGTVGSLIDVKGHIYLIKAAQKVIKKFPDIQFLVVGDGLRRKELQNQVKEMKLAKHFLFVGLRNDIPEIYSLMDVFVLASIEEGMPMVILEAMASGKPIISTKVGSVPKAVIDQHNGILVPPKNYEDLAKAIEFMITNEKKARTYAINALKKVNDEFLSEVMCKQYVSIYENMLKMK
jgi:glycosyltransferase involved in cell wall biosynthesis